MLERTFEDSGDFQTLRGERERREGGDGDRVEKAESVQRVERVERAERIERVVISGLHTNASCMGVEGQNWTNGSIIWISRTMLAGPMIHPTCNRIQNYLTARSRAFLPHHR